MGFKLTHTDWTYNLTVNHPRRIISTTKGHPALFNDKTLITFNEFVNWLKNGMYGDEYEFALYNYDEYKNVIKVKYRGCWLIVDKLELYCSTIEN